jgi:bifunctional non-homologous end joining protein LigD
MTDLWPPVYEPMRAVNATVPTEDGWAFEVKWDGMRVLARVANGLRLHSGRGLDVTDRFPELGQLGAHLDGHVVALDGEVVALDGSGRADFGRLQPRMQAQSQARVERLRSEVTVSLVVFDLLHLDGHDTLDVAYADRRRLLAELVGPGSTWSVPAHQVGDGGALYRAAAEQGVEGIMAKRLDSTYRPGKRSPAWRKCKVRRRQEVVIGGWSTGQGSRSSSLGSLLVGVHDPGAPGHPLRFAGGVGTGFTSAALVDLGARLAPLAADRCPFTPQPPPAVRRTARWVEPVLVAEVAFAEWTSDGRLRHPSHLGLRTDKDPTAVVREPPGAEDGGWA